MQTNVYAIIYIDCWFINMINLSIIGLLNPEYTFRKVHMILVLIYRGLLSLEMKTQLFPG